MKFILLFFMFTLPLIDITACQCLGLKWEDALKSTEIIVAAEIKDIERLNLVQKEEVSLLIISVEIQKIYKGNHDKIGKCFQFLAHECILYPEIGEKYFLFGNRNLGPFYSLQNFCETNSIVSKNSTDKMKKTFTKTTAPINRLNCSFEQEKKPQTFFSLSKILLGLSLGSNLLLILLLKRKNSN